MEIRAHTILLSKPEITALARYASSDSARANLCAVWFDVEAGWASAMDGRRALRAWGVKEPQGRKKAPPALPPMGIPREQLLRIARMGKIKSEYRIDLDAYRGEVWEHGVRTMSMPFEPDPGPCPPFDKVGFEGPTQTKGLPVWYVDVLSLEVLVCARLGWEAATGNTRLVKTVQIESPASELDPLRCTFGCPEEPHCWRVILMTRRDAGP